MGEARKQALYGPFPLRQAIFCAALFLSPATQLLQDFAFFCVCGIYVCVRVACMCLCFHVCGMSINCRPHILTTLQSKSLHEPKSLNLVRQLALGDPCFHLPSTGIGSEVSYQH